MTVQVDIQANTVLEGDEWLSLTMDNVSSVDDLKNDSPTGKAFIKNFNDCGIEGP